MTLKGAVVQKLFDQFSFLIRNVNEVERVLTASTVIKKKFIFRQIKRISSLLK